jgi:hypothetical protein|tara:strand:+ start:2256 stop:2501 length:246 start_codon:yes stop_codon:yes gene_type:complete
MKNQSDDILETLTLANGKEEVEKMAAPKKKVAKKSAKKTKYSYEELKKKKPYELEAICKELNISVDRFNKLEVIKNILDKN